MACVTVAFCSARLKRCSHGSEAVVPVPGKSVKLPRVAMAADVAALFTALQSLTEQVKLMAEKGTGGGGKRWDHPDRYKNLKVYGGDVKEFEEWSVKFRSLVSAGGAKVGQLMKVVEHDCSEDELAKNKYTQASPEFDESDEEFIIQTAAEMYNLLLNITTGEANAVVRRSLGSGWLAWKRLTSSLNPRTLASGIKAISSVLNPTRVVSSAKADQVLDEWEDKMVKLQVEYGQVITSKMKVAVLYAMMPKDLQEKVLDACAVNWDETSEQDAGQLYLKVKGQLKNLAKARREMQGPKPMEVDRVSSSWADWGGDWATEWGGTKDEAEDKDDSDKNEEAFVQFIGKGGGKKGGKGFQGHCFVCGEFGHSQWDCFKGKGKGKGYGKEGMYGKGYGKDNMYYKGYGKDGMYGKGYGKDGGNYLGYGKGKGGDGKGGMPRACFGCGATDHLLRDCPNNPSKVNQVEQEQEPEVLFIGNVRDEWKKVPMKVNMANRNNMNTQVSQTFKEGNRFRVLEVDEEDDFEDEVVHVRAVEMNEQSAGREWEHVLAKVNSEVGFVCAVGNREEMASLGVGDIIVDSAADESCWPLGQGDAFPTKASSRTLRLKTANGADMGHYGEKEVMFKYKGGENKEPVGIKFQVTDVKKPLLAVRRLVEKGCTVTLANGEGESFIMNKETRVRIPVVKKGGSFVIEAQFVKKLGKEGFARQV